MGTNKIIQRYKTFPVQVRASLWFLVCSFLQKGISMITTPIFTRLMSTSEYGDFGTWNSWQGMLSIVIALSLSQGVYGQGLIKFENNRKEFSSSLQGLSTILVLFWLAVYLLFHDFWNNLFHLSTIQMIALLLMIWTSAVFQFWATEQRVEYLYDTLVIVTLVVSLAKPILSIVLIQSIEDKVTARILGLLIVEVLGYSWMYISQMRRGKKFFSKHFWIYALSFNIPLIPHYLSQIVLNSSDRIMIQRMVGSSEAGIYNLAYSVSLIMTLFNTALMQTVTPWMYKKIKEKRGKEIAPIAYTTLIIIACVNLFLIILAPEVVRIFAPTEYYEAIWVIPPVAMSVFYMYSYDLFAKFSFYYEKTKFIMIASVCGAAINVLLNYIFISRYGYIAAGYTTLLCYIVYSVAHYLFMRKVCDQCCNGDYPYDTKKIMMISITFTLMGFLLLFTYNFPIIRYSLLGLGMIGVLFNWRRIVKTIKGMLNLKDIS